MRLYNLRGCGISVSKSAVSDICTDLNHEVKALRNRPIEGNYPLLTVEATPRILRYVRTAGLSRKRYDHYDAPGRNASLPPDIKPYRAVESRTEAAFRRCRDLSK